MTSWARCITIGLAAGFVLGLALNSWLLGIVFGVLTGAGFCLVSKRRERGEQN